MSVYIRPEHLKNIIEVYQKTSDPVVGEMMAQVFLKMADGLLQRHKFSSLSHEDMKQEAMLVCFRKVGQFDPERSPGFNYFTTLIMNSYKGAFRNAMRRERLKEEAQDLAYYETSYHPDKENESHEDNSYGRVKMEYAEVHQTINKLSDIHADFHSALLREDSIFYKKNGTFNIVKIKAHYGLSTLRVETMIEDIKQAYV